jgi:hypothetical protein
VHLYQFLHLSHLTTPRFASSPTGAYTQPKRGVLKIPSAVWTLVEAVSTKKTLQMASHNAEAVATLVVHDLVQLHAITHRRLAATVERRARVELALLPQALPERARWERALGRWGRACGCQSSAVVALLTMVWLAMAGSVFARPLFGALAYGAGCVAAGVGSGVLTKLIAIAWARRRLQDLQERVAAALALQKGAK